MKSVIRVQRRETDQVAHLINKTHGVKPRPDFSKRNYQAIRTLQTQIEEQRSQAALPKPKLFKLSRFGSVASLVFKKPEEIQELRKGQRHSPSLPASRVSQKRVEQVNESVYQKNFIAENAKEAIAAVPKPVPEVAKETTQTLNPSFGKVPAYLQRYNQEATEVLNKRRAAEETKCPRGMRLLSKEEQQATLDTLLEDKRQTIIFLNRVPLASTTPSILKRRDDLERKLEDLDTSIGVFSRPRVYVQV